MKYLKIKNTGLLDLRLIYLMGGTTKAEDQYKIGQFGTGLKYVLAYLLRNNIDFKIFIGSDEIKINVKEEVIRETSFGVIYINGDRTAITTNMGNDWKAWMIVREIWCNALDEENPEFSIEETFNSDNNETQFYIQLVGDINEVYENWDKYFIHNKLSIQNHENFALYEPQEYLRIYKNGVLIKEFPNKKSVFSYDIKTADINELREFNGSINCELNYILPHFSKESAEIFINNIKDTYENEMDFGYTWDKFGDGWKDCIGNAKVVDYDTYKKMEGKYPNLETENIIQIPKGLFKKLIKYYPHISAVRASDKLGTFFETYSDILNDKVKKCILMLEKVGYFIDPELKILFGVFGNKEVIGQINYDDKELRLSQDLENKDDFELITTLIEENEHYKTSFSDNTREFQQHFIDLYSNLLLKDVKVLL